MTAFRRRTARAFTLLELLVCLAIIGVLTGVTIPLYARVSQQSRAAACVSNLRQLGAGLSLYLGEHNMRMPTLLSGRKLRTDPGPVIDDTLNTYVTNPAVFLCPADTGGVGAGSGTSYYWNVLINGQSAAALHMLNLTTVNSHIPVLCDKGAFHPYQPTQVNLLYADGHAEKEFTFMTDTGSK